MTCWLMTTRRDERDEGWGWQGMGIWRQESTVVEGRRQEYVAIIDESCEGASEVG